MPKCDTLTAIMALNPSATPDFLAEFPQDELKRYLSRLADARHGDASRCVPRRDGEEACASQPGLSQADHV